MRNKTKKRVDPRYFLNESVAREDLIDEIREASKAMTGSRDTYGDIDKLVELDIEELKELLRGLSEDSSSGVDAFRDYPNDGKSPPWQDPNAPEEVSVPQSGEDPLQRVKTLAFGAMKNQRR